MEIIYLCCVVFSPLYFTVSQPDGGELLKVPTYGTRFTLSKSKQRQLFCMFTLSLGMHSLLM